MGGGMSDLAELIDCLPPPEIPCSLGPADQQLIQLLIESARLQVRPYTGDYKAPWLLVPFESDVWETTNRGREELIDGQWKNTVRVDWRVQLPNGFLLTDARYEKLLTLIKKVSFLMRCGLIRGDSAPRSWLAITNKLMSIPRWVILNEDRFQPEIHALQLLDQAALDWLLVEVAKGGMMQALLIPQRLLAALYLGAHGTSCPRELLDKPYALPSSEIPPLIRWIEEQGGYKKPTKGPHKKKRFLSRTWLGQLINEPTYALKVQKGSQFCRQFEPDFQNPLMTSALQTTEFPSQRTKSMYEEQEGSSENNLLHVSGLFGSLLDAHRHLPDLLPEPASLSIRRSFNLALRYAKSSGHTPFMPVTTGLAYLNTAMRFIHVYGEAIVGLYFAVLPVYTAGNDALSHALERHARDWRVATGEPITKVLNITEFRRQGSKRDFGQIRSNPTLDDALRVLIGACIVCIAILKPSRDEELKHLKRCCIRHDSNGYWFNFNLGKSNVKGVEVWQEEDRPIPVITAQGIQLLQRVGDGLSQLIGEDTKAADNLFYLPKTQGLGALSMNTDLLSLHLDLFCDFVGLPPDSEGRRWYVRIHEMRKWFLLLLFWSGRFDVLDAARWIAGHTDANHIYAYIEKEFPGESLPQIEAEYSGDRLRRLEQGQSGNEDGVNALYETVLKHFNVESLSMIPESEWAGYVRSLRESDAFYLEPHSIRDEDGAVVGINVSFVMRPVA